MSLPATSAHAVSRRTTSAATVAAIGAVDYALATCVHHAIGGAIANVVSGAAAFVFLRRIPPYRGATWYAVWLFAAVSLFMGSGSLVINAIAGASEGALASTTSWRIAMGVAGAIVGVGSLVVLVRAIEPLLGDRADARRQTSRLLAWVPYASGCIVVTLAALASPLGMAYVAASALMSFGATSFLAWLPAWTRATHRHHASLELPVHPAWILAGLAAALSLALLGRQLPG